MKTSITLTTLKLFAAYSGEGEHRQSSWQPNNREIENICKINKEKVVICGKEVQLSIIRLEDGKELESRVFQPLHYLNN